MPIMTRKEETILDKLITLAGGDKSLVEMAFKSISKDINPDLSDVVKYILKKKGISSGTESPSSKNETRSNAA